MGRRHTRFLPNNQGEKHMDNFNFTNMTVEQFAELKKKMDEAEHDTTPYAVADDDEIMVIGDVNNTEVQKHIYTIQFAYPNTEYWRDRLEEDGVKIEKETPNYLGVTKQYQDVWVPPRVYTAVQTAFAEVYQFMNMTTEDGEIRDLTNEEMIEALHILSQDMIEAMCHAVATVLRIEPTEELFMLPTSTMATISLLISDFPEIINGMDFFTEQSSESKPKSEHQGTPKLMTK